MALTTTISELPSVITPEVELPGGVFEVEVLTGPVAGAYVNKKLTAAQAIAYFVSAPNLRPDAEKRVRFLTTTESTAGGGGASLEGLPASGLCLGSEALVELYQKPGKPVRFYVRMRLVYDNRPAGSAGRIPGVFLDGNFSGTPNVPAVWVEADSQEEAAAKLRRYDAAVTDWKQDETVKILFQGDTSDSFFSVLQVGGPFPAPVKGQTTAYWRPAAAPAPSYQLPGPNLRADAEKRVKWLTNAQSAAEGFGASSLEGLPASGLCLNAEATVDLYDLPGRPRRFRVKLVLAYDADPAGLPDSLRTLAYADGDFTGNPTAPGVWVEAATPEQAAASVRRYATNIADWQADETLKIKFSGDASDSFFTVLQAGGPFPSPVKGQTDAYYRPAAAPQPAVPFTAQLDLDSAKGPSGVAALRQAGFGVATAINGDWNAGNDSGRTVVVEGLPDGSFASSGLLQLEGGGSQQVTVDVRAGSYSRLAMGADNPSPVVVVGTGPNDPNVGFNNLADALAFSNANRILLNTNLVNIPGFSYSDAAILGQARRIASDEDVLIGAGAENLNLEIAGSLQLSGTFFHCGFGNFKGNDAILEYCRGGYGSVDSGSTLRLRPGTSLPADFFATFTKNSDGSYTTPDGGTVYDERGGAGGASGPAAPQWVAGPQATGSLVYNTGKVYRVQQDIANSQAAPTASSQYYLQVGPGGSGSSIDYANPTTLNQASTLQANKAYYLTGSGYALTLPASPAIGDLLFLLVAQDATGLYPITGTDYAMYRRESVTLRYTANGWTKTGGEMLAMLARIETAGNQQDALTYTNGFQTIPFSALESNNGVPGLPSLPENGFRVPRTATISLVASAVIANANAGGQFYFIVEAYMPDANQTKILAGAYPVVASTGIGVVNVPVPPRRLTANTLLRLRVYTAPGSSANLAGGGDGNQCAFTYAEQL